MAFGEETITTVRTNCDDYTGYQKDDESGLEYAQARYYNTGLGIGCWEIDFASFKIDILPIQSRDFTK